MLEDTNASIVLTNESHKQRLEGIVRSRASQLISRDEQFEKNKEVVESSKENNIDEKLSNKNKIESKIQADSSENKNAAALSKTDDVNFEGSVYKFLDTKLEYYSPEKQLLKFNLNIANNINGVYVSSDLFRLLVGRNIRAPETCTTEWIAQHSSIDAEVTFLIPNDVNAVRFQIGDVNSGEKGTIKIPIDLNSK